MRGGAVEFKAWRFSFFNCSVPDDVLPYIRDDNYLGYAILVRLTLPNKAVRSYVYESVIATPSVDDIKHSDSALPGHYLHCVRKYSGWVGDHRFSVCGSFFSQQNGLTNVCAHAALRWLLNNIPERAEKILSCEDINEILGIDHHTRKVGAYEGDASAQGLSVADMETVVEYMGCQPLGVDYRNSVGHPQPYWHLIYTIIESGYPVLVFFNSDSAEHVVCAIGHTLNTDIWDEEAKLAYVGAPAAPYLSSGNWADHFVIHDDNYGMYFCMSRKALADPSPEHRPFEVTGALGILPTGTDVFPLEAELYGSLILRWILVEEWLEAVFWIDELRKLQDAGVECSVLRTLFISRDAYHEHLRSIEDPEGNFLTEDDIRTILPENHSFFWMVEFSLTDIYTANKRKLGEVLLAPNIAISGASATESDTELLQKSVFQGCLAIRLPGHIIIPSVTETGISFSIKRTELEGHVPLFRTCRASPAWEW